MKACLVPPKFLKNKLFNISHRTWNLHLLKLAFHTEGLNQLFLHQKGLATFTVAPIARKQEAYQCHHNDN